MTFADVNVNVATAFALMVIALAISYLAFGRPQKISK